MRGLGLVVGWVLLGTVAMAQTRQPPATQDITVNLGASKRIDVGLYQTVRIPEKGIIEVTPLGSRSLSVLGVSLGKSQVVAIDAEGNEISTISVDVVAGAGHAIRFYGPVQLDPVSKRSYEYTVRHCTAVACGPALPGE